ncbi:HEAT repeat domain-containing protein [Rhodopirellula sp. MGV]|uniref:HEAT repeat domain-containing protein n=1 Tax=Rhodopirellula sp. MGV TaxID=2023130 RepID=UPI000B963C38|nr:HEAT repeat domain-containing protein [Rhodopirellula sp. MGV]OYP34542.1 PBS lyase [Rhodopirellula sp. MGV]PNY36742.1 PBS lyase [Rhodopirellula baltica]
MNHSNTSLLLKQLESQDGVQRTRAREKLVAISGPDITRALIGKLISPRAQVRWEAAKCLLSISDPIAAIPLVHAMDDEDENIRWIASEGVAQLGESGLMALLSGLTRQAPSSVFCRAAHHALRDLEKSGVHREVVRHVIQAIEGFEPTLSTPIAAYKALRSLQTAQAQPA